MPVPMSPERYRGWLSLVLVSYSREVRNEIINKYIIRSKISVGDVVITNISTSHRGGEKGVVVYLSGLGLAEILLSDGQTFHISIAHLTKVR